MSNITDYRTIAYFDVETTSLDATKGEIIQICIITEDREGNLDEWSTKIRPRLKPGTFQRSALKINNFKPKDYIDAPIFEDVADTIIEKLRWGPIVAHNAQFDISFIAFKYISDSADKDASIDWKENLNKGQKLFKKTVLDSLSLF